MLRESGYQALAPDSRVFAYLAVLTLLAACIAGLAPARESLKVDLLTSLNGHQSAATVRSGMWSALIVAQMAMSFVLVTAGVACTRIELGVSGVYGTVAFSISQRTREFGIRMALGATRGRILRSVSAFGVRQIGIGLLMGVLLAMPAAFAFWHLLRNPSLFDWTTYSIATLALTLAAPCAYYIPTRRAMHVDPMVALRYE